MGLELSPILYVTDSINVISNGTFSTVCSTLAVSGCTITACNFDDSQQQGIVHADIRIVYR